MVASVFLRGSVNFQRFVFAVLALAARLATVKAQMSCITQDYYLPSNQQVFNITSPNYPGAYRPGTNCRFRLIAPYAHVVVLNCIFDVYPNACGTEYFYISRDGDLDFREGETYCTNTNIVRNSYFRPMTVGYYSSSLGTNQQGRFFCQAYAQRQPCNCGWTTQTRITNGQEATKHEYPSMVALRDIGSSQQIFCGGSIVSNRHIMTAAHCINVQPDARRIIAYVGDHDLSSNTESIFAVQHRIQQIIIHPNYASTANGVVNDLALLITIARIEWSRGVGPICLPLLQSSDLFTYRTVDVTGWGTTSFAGPKSNTLQKVELMTVENSACETQFNTTITAAHICTHDYRGLGQDSCQYDSGGPVILRQQQQLSQPSRMYALGVISYGGTCGSRYAVGVNTRITSYLRWIWNYLQNVGGVCVP
ncbi:venom serine protease [Bactrocera neohumeralis]|uniref:venom serine protease n=1 Tax=Bactrocera neohumeralis TaxID=98809 RepID=UPI00216595E4|nr:venom serine protease [Bactrocera neohumeralis]